MLIVTSFVQLLLLYTIFLIFFLFLAYSQNPNITPVGYKRIIVFKLSWQEKEQVKLVLVSKSMLFHNMFLFQYFIVKIYLDPTIFTTS